MKKNKMLKNFIPLLVSMLIVPMCSMTLHAEEAESPTGIGFQSDTNPTDPVDPIDPTDPGEGPGTGMEGPLSLDYVPPLQFGIQEITGRVETYETTNLKPYIQVTDKRGTGEGWTVKASLSEFTDTGDGTKTLNGVVISFDNSEVKSTPTNTATAPTGQNFSLTAGANPVLVTNADIDEGMGTWVNSWLASDYLDGTNDNVRLTVNTAGAYTVQYQGTINWSIELAP